MDKETLSNYGWVVICVLVMVVMIALATPFGSFIANAVKNTTSALFGATQERAEIAGLNIEDVVFPCDHEYENDRCKNCGQLDPNHTHTYPATGLSAKCEVCGEIKDHTCTYGSNNLCTKCGEEKTYTFTITSANRSAIGYVDGMTQFTIPEEFVATADMTTLYAGVGTSSSNQLVEGRKYKVTSMDYNAFGSTSLTSVTIPGSITKIQMYAFRNCTSLTSVTIQDGVTEIYVYAFEGCTSLSSVTIPESVTSIGGSAFKNCKALTAITLPSGITNIGQETFYGCSSLTSITIPDGVTSIRDGAFQACSSLTSANIPDGVTEIGDYAFWCCPLTSITIPDGIKKYGSGFNSNSSLTSATYQGITYTGSAYEINQAIKTALTNNGVTLGINF